MLCFVAFGHKHGRQKRAFLAQKCTVSGLKRQFDKWLLFHASTGGGDSPRKLPLEDMDFCPPKLAIFSRIPVEGGQFQGPLEIQNFHVPSSCRRFDPPYPGLQLESAETRAIFNEALRFVRPRCTREMDGIAAKRLRCGVASEALRRNIPAFLSLIVWISLLNFQQGMSLLKWVFSLLFPGFLTFPAGKENPW